MPGKFGLKPWPSAKRLDDRNVGKGLRCNRTRPAKRITRYGGEPLEVATANSGQDQVSGQQGDEHSSELGNTGEGDNVCSYEEAELTEETADLLVRAGLDGSEVIVKAGTNITGMFVVKEGRFLAKQMAEVPLPQPVGQALGLDVPTDVVEVDEHELRCRNIRELANGGVDRVLVFEGIGVEVFGLGGARGGVKVIHQLSEEDAHERKWDTSSDREDRTPDHQEEVEPCRLCEEQESEPGQQPSLSLRSRVNTTIEELSWKQDTRLRPLTHLRRLFVGYSFLVSHLAARE